jgi:hypothetical protein
MPPGMLTGVFIPKVYVAVIVKVSAAFGSEKYVDRGIE